MIKDSLNNNKLPFKEIKVYYSGSVKGMPEDDLDFPYEVVQFMIKSGARVLSEHVAAKTSEDRDKVMAKNIGKTIKEVKNHPKPWDLIRKTDMNWVDEADCMVAVVNSPSHGVGMEIERAILKEERGLTPIPILCLVKDGMLDKLSFMIRGVNNDNFYLKTYRDLSSAKRIVSKFLSNRLRE
jgi:hypothetical protein